MGEEGPVMAGAVEESQRQEAGNSPQQTDSKSRKGVVTSRKGKKALRFQLTVSWSPVRCVLALVLSFLFVTAIQMKPILPQEYRSWSGLIASMMDRSAGPRVVGWNLFALVLAMVLYICLETWKESGARERMLSGVGAALLAWSTVFPLTAEQNKDYTRFPYFAPEPSSWSSKRLILITLFRWLVVAIVLFILFLAASVHLKRDEGTVATLQEKVVQQQGKLQRTENGVLSRLRFAPGPVFSLSGIIYVCWIPFLLVNAPFGVGWDTMTQLIQFRGYPAWDQALMIPLKGYWMSDQHPFFDSIIYGAFDLLGKNVFHNEVTGLTLLMYLQAYCCALALALLFCWVNNRSELKREALWTILLVLCFVPTFALTETQILKDATWLTFFILWGVCFAEYTHRILNQKKLTAPLIVLLVLAAVLAGLTKKTSSYVTFGATLLLLFLPHKRWKTLVASLVPPFIVLLLIPATLYPVLRIAPGGRQEPLMVPITQVSKVFKDHGNEIPRSDWDTVNQVIDIKKARNLWIPEDADPPKVTFRRTTATREDIAAFLGEWVKLGLRYPVSYVHAIPYVWDSFALGRTYYTTGAVKSGWWWSGGYGVMPGVPDGYQSWNQKKVAPPVLAFLNTVPPYSLLGDQALYVAWIPLLSALLCVERKRYAQLAYLLPSVMNICVQLLIAAAQIRFSLGLLGLFMLNLAAPFLPAVRLEHGHSRGLAHQRPDSQQSETIAAVTKGTEREIAS